jgi:hypothetical protein
LSFSVSKNVCHEQLKTLANIMGKFYVVFFKVEKKSLLLF